MTDQRTRNLFLSASPQEQQEMFEKSETGIALLGHLRKMRNNNQGCDNERQTYGSNNNIHNGSCVRGVMNPSTANSSNNNHNSTTNQQHQQQISSSQSIQPESPLLNNDTRRSLHGMKTPQFNSAKPNTSNQSTPSESRPIQFVDHFNPTKQKKKKK